MWFFDKLCDAPIQLTHIANGDSNQADVSDSEGELESTKEAIFYSSPLGVRFSHMASRSLAMRLPRTIRLLPTRIPQIQTRHASSAEPDLDTLDPNMVSLYLENDSWSPSLPSYRS